MTPEELKAKNALLKKDKEIKRLQMKLRASRANESKHKRAFNKIKQEINKLHEYVRKLDDNE